MAMSDEDIKNKLGSLLPYLQDILHENVYCERMDTFYHGSRKER